MSVFNSFMQTFTLSTEQMILAAKSCIRLAITNTQLCDLSQITVSTKIVNWIGIRIIRYGWIVNHHKFFLAFFLGLNRSIFSTNTYENNWSGQKPIRRSTRKRTPDCSIHLDGMMLSKTSFTWREGDGLHASGAPPTDNDVDFWMRPNGGCLHVHVDASARQLKESSSSSLFQSAWHNLIAQHARKRERERERRRRAIDGVEAANDSFCQVDSTSYIPTG